MSRRQQRANLAAFVIGAAATALVLAAYLAGGLDWAELKTLDLRFRYANATPTDPRITCIDIDDASLDKVGRWPWPRDEQAGLLRVLSELGARAILVDLTYAEPQPVRPLVPRDADMLADPFELADADLDTALPDDELRAAIAAAGNVYLAVHYDPDAWDRSADFQAAVAAVRAEDGDAAALAQRRGIGLERARQLWRAARVVPVLEDDPLCSDEIVAQQTGLELSFVRQVYERCRQFVLRGHVRARLAERPEWRDLPPHEVLRRLYAELSDRALADETPLRAALVATYRDLLSYDATMARQLAVPADLRAWAAPAEAVTPVYFRLAEAARSCGFVAYEPDADGVMRHNALLSEHDGQLLTQLAFAVACDVLDVRTADMVVRGGRLRLPLAEGGERVITLDPHGRLLMPWVAERDWTRQFGTHVPADALWTVHDRRRQLEHNRQLVAHERHALFAGALLPDNNAYRQDLAALLEIELAAGAARRHGDSVQAAELIAQAAQLAEQMAAWEATALQWLRAVAAGAAPDAAMTPSDAEFVLRQVAQLEALAERGAAANAALAHEVEQTLGWLRPRVTDQVCLIGYTATSLADMTPIPTHPRAPGVIAHANLLNGLLTGQMVTAAPTALNALLAALCGLAASVLSTWRPPRAAALWVLALLAAFLAVHGWWMFQARGTWVAVTPAVGTILVSYVAIGTYRYFFLDRERRELTTALSQYTSATLARKMAEDAELCRRAEAREVTAMFTDFQGFTPISERIGPERTQRVLNICLGRCSEIMLAHEAMINKFIGDGIFAFWNPVIYPQPRHAEQACRTAVELMKGLARLIDEQRQSGGDEVFQELVLRIGVATGSAVVGPCGSEQKYDYTCIGDTVNVAARLESANKFYGTRILVSGATRAQVGDAFVFRPLGGVRVKGKHQAVPIFELLGRAGDVSEDLCAYADQFGQAVTHFQQRDWPAARVAFQTCRTQRPADQAVDRYLAALDEYSQHPPPPDWSGAIELTEK